MSQKMRSLVSPLRIKMYLITKQKLDYRDYTIKYSYTVKNRIEIGVRLIFSVHCFYIICSTFVLRLMTQIQKH